MIRYYLIAIAVYFLLNVLFNAVVVDVLDLRIAGLSENAVDLLHRATQVMSTLGISLLLMRFYIQKVKAPRRFSVWNGVVCGGIIVGAFFVIAPLERNLLNWVVNKSTATMRRDALVLAVTSYGITSGDVTMQELNINKDTYQGVDVRSFLAVINPVLIMSDGFEVVNLRFPGVLNLILKNEMIRHDRLIATTFDIGMKTSCTGLMVLEGRFKAQAIATTQTYKKRQEDPGRDPNWLQNLQGDWRHQVNEIFGYDAAIDPAVPEGQFRTHPAVQLWIRRSVTDSMDSSLPSLLAPLDERQAIKGYLRQQMAERVTDPCKTSWSSFKAAGHRDEALKATAGHFVEVVTKDSERLGPGGDLEPIGRAAVLIAVVPTFAIGMSVAIAALQALTAVSLILTYYVVVKRRIRRGIVLGLAALFVLIPLLSSHLVADTKVFQARLGEVAARGFHTGMVLAAASNWLLRAEPSFYLIGHELREALVPDLFRMLGGTDETDGEGAPPSAAGTVGAAAKGLLERVETGSE